MLNACGGTPSSLLYHLPGILESQPMKGWWQDIGVPEVDSESSASALLLHVLKWSSGVSKTLVWLIATHPFASQTPCPLTWLINYSRRVSSDGASADWHHRAETRDKSDRVKWVLTDGDWLVTTRSHSCIDETNGCPWPQAAGQWN